MRLLQEHPWRREQVVGSVMLKTLRIDIVWLKNGVSVTFVLDYVCVCVRVRVLAFCNPVAGVIV